MTECAGRPAQRRDETPAARHGAARLVPTFWLRAQGTTAVVALTAVALFAGGGYEMQRRQARRAAWKQAQAYASVIRPGQPAAESESIEAMRSRHREVLAVATLDAQGNIDAAYPERPACRQALLPACVAADQAVASVLEVGGQRVPVWGANVTLDGASGPSARRAVVLLARRPWWHDQLGVTTGFALAMVSIALFAGHLLCAWFKRRVAAPLCALSEAVEQKKPLAKMVAELPGSEWWETRELQRRVLELYGRASNSETRLHDVQQRSREQLRACEIGFERQLQRVKEQTLIDPLTGLRNRRFLESELEQFVGKQRDAGCDFSIVMLDVDNFKQHNDACGHAAGDELLRFLGALLRGALRHDDAAVRYGGDEFMLLLAGTGPRQAVLITERITKLFHQYAQVLRTPCPPSLSAGVVALSSHPNADCAELTARADAALYEAKHRGKNAVVTAA